VPDYDPRIAELMWELDQCVRAGDEIGALVAVASLMYFPLTAAQRARVRWAICPSTAGEPVAGELAPGPALARRR
jgi:hypothetical protein